MDNIVGNYFLHNNDLFTLDSINNININKENVVYDVIRIIDSVPLFLEAHFIRLKKSLNLAGIDIFFTLLDLKKIISTVIKVNNTRACNVKIIIYNNNFPNILAFINESYYPSIYDMENGVGLDVINIVRDSPNIKAINYTYKNTINQLIKEKNVFEVLLINNNGIVTEGSRSNVFFVKEDKVYTTPSELILEGVTRRYIIEACNDLGINVIETLINKSRLSELDALFICGTSIKVLPVSNVGEYKYNSSTNKLVMGIKNQFDKKIDEYILSLD